MAVELIGEFAVPLPTRVIGGVVRSRGAPYRQIEAVRGRQRRSDFRQPCRTRCPYCAPTLLGHSSRDSIAKSLNRKAGWWTHRGSNLGPLPCEEPPHHRDGFW